MIDPAMAAEFMGGGGGGAAVSTSTSTSNSTASAGRGAFIGITSGSSGLGNVVLTAAAIGVLLVLFRGKR